MNDTYSDALDRMEKSRALQWEYLEESREDEDDLSDENLDVSLTDNQRQWIYDDVAIA
jgi:hypothetical protein